MSTIGFSAQMFTGPKVYLGKRQRFFVISKYSPSRTDPLLPVSGPPNFLLNIRDVAFSGQCNIRVLCPVPSLGYTIKAWNVTNIVSKLLQRFLYQSYFKDSCIKATSKILVSKLLQRHYEPVFLIAKSCPNNSF